MQDAETIPIAERINRLDWEEIQRQLDRRGFARTPRILSPEECTELAELYDAGRFRKCVDMGRHGYGEGEYKYFDDPLPALVAELRAVLYSRLAPVANRWAMALGEATTYPPDLDGFLALCRGGGQARPTPLLLRYDVGGYNCLHQDLYGPLAFPIQAVFVLSQPGRDFDGGEFLLVEQRPRAQSRGEALAPGQGEALLFTNHSRPEAGARGVRRVSVRHGVSTLRSGRRYSLGIIFHNAE